MEVLDLVKTLGFTRVHLQTESQVMKAQLIGICVSLMVHSAAAGLLVGISRGLTPPIKTVVLDFTLDRPGSSADSAGEVEPAGAVEGPGSNEDPVDNALALQPEKTNPASAPPPPVVKAPKRLPPKPLPPAPPPVNELSRLTVKEIEKPQQVVQKKPSAIPIKPVETAPQPPVPTVVEQKIAPEPPLETATGQQPIDSSKTVADATPMPPAPDSDRDAPTSTPWDAAAFSGLDRFNENTGSPNEGRAINAYRGSRSGSGTADRKTGVPGTGAANAYLDAHFSYIRSHLSEHLCYPAIARKRGWSGKVVVSFIINPDGDVADIKINQSCGISLLDQSAIKTVRSACPFPIPPMAAQITIPIVYQLD